MSFEDFKTEVMAKVNARPPFIRKGQAVFNTIDAFYGVARAVQFEDGIDCFYNDKKIDEFLEASWTRIK